MKHSLIRKKSEELKSKKLSINLKDDCKYNEPKQPDNSMTSSMTEDQ